MNQIPQITTVAAAAAAAVSRPAQQRPLPAQRAGCQAGWGAAAAAAAATVVFYSFVVVCRMLYISLYLI